MNVQMEGDQKLARHARRYHSGARKPRLRNLHESAIRFGDAAVSYTTNHQQSYSGRTDDGRPLAFHRRDPSFPSQHHTRLDLSSSTQPQSQLQTHNQEVHGSKHVILRTDQKMENWARHRSGQAIREITHPPGPCEYRTTYRTEHTPPVADGSTLRACGVQSLWHQHNILTGEAGQTAGPGNPCRRSRDKLLWASRRRETDYSALRLY